MKSLGPLDIINFFMVILVFLRNAQLYLVVISVLFVDDNVMEYVCSDDFQSNTSGNVDRMDCCINYNKCL